MGASLHAPIEVEFRATGIDAVRSGLRVIRSESGDAAAAVGTEAKAIAHGIEGVSHGAIIGIGELTRGVARIAETGTASAFSMRELSGGIMRLGQSLGPGAGLIGVFAILGGVIVETFMKARHEIEETRKKFQEEIAQMANAGESSRLQTQLRELQFGKPFDDKDNLTPVSAFAKGAFKGSLFDLMGERNMVITELGNATNSAQASMLLAQKNRLDAQIAPLIDKQRHLEISILNVASQPAQMQGLLPTRVTATAPGAGDRQAATDAREIRAIELDALRAHTQSVNRIAEDGRKEQEEHAKENYQAGRLALNEYIATRERLTREGVAAEIAAVTRERDAVLGTSAVTDVERAKREAQVAALNDKINEISAAGQRDLAAIAREGAAEREKIDREETERSVSEAIKRANATMAAFKKYQEAIGGLREGGLTPESLAYVQDAALERTRRELPGVDESGDEFNSALTKNLLKVGGKLQSTSQTIGSMIGSSIAQGIRDGIAKHSVGAAFAGLARGILAGLGSIFIQIGETALAGMAFVQAIAKALITLNPAVGIPAALGLIALGAVLQGLGSGGGGGGGYSGGSSGSLPAIVNTGYLNTPWQSTATQGASVTPSKNVTNQNFFIGNDPAAWRQIQEKLDMNARRG